MSTEALLHQEDTSPVAIGTVGAPNVVAAPARSLWQTDAIGIRAVLDCAYAMRSTGAVAWLQSATW